MNIYLNTNTSLKKFKELYRDEYFVDKTEIIPLLNKKINTNNKYICITRPRRFGKTSITNMIGAYYTKGCNSRVIFDNLKLSTSKTYEENLNKYNVISISFNEIPDNMKTYDQYINNIIKDCLMHKNVFD